MPISWVLKTHLLYEKSVQVIISYEDAKDKKICETEQVSELVAFI